MRSAAVRIARALADPDRIGEVERIATVAAKDLRLAFDALRPLGVLLGGFVGVGLLITFLPESMRPAVIRYLKAGDFLTMVAGAFLLPSPFVAGWCAATVLVGDRRHGELSLISTLPVGGRARVVGRMIGLLPALVGPTAIVVLLEMLELWAASARNSTPFSAALPVGVLAGSTVGVAAVIVAAMWRRSIVSMQLVGYGGVVVGIVVLVALARLSFAVVASDITRIAAITGELPYAESIGRDATSCAVALAVGAGALVAFAVALAHVHTARSRRWRRWGMIATAAVAGIVAIAATPLLAFGSDSISSWSAWRRRDAVVATDAQLRASIASLMQSLRRGSSPSDAELQAWDEGVHRIAMLPPEERASSELWRTFESNETFGSPQEAIWSSMWIPESDPRGEFPWLQAIAAFPNEQAALYRLRRLLQSAHAARFSPMASVNDSDAVAVARWQFAMLDGADETMSQRERTLRATVIERLREAWPELDRDMQEGWFRRGNWQRMKDINP